MNIATGWPEHQQWVDEVRRLEESRSPWPGPRPLREADGEALLIGRTEDLEEILRLVRSVKFIHLIGRSGVGKSSLLAAGVVPNLRDKGFTVAMCRDWNAFADIAEGDFDIALASALHESLPAAQRLRMSPNTDIFWELHDLHGAGVIVLDQFEEFLRKEPDKRQAALDFLMNLHAESSVKIILSYRSEYLDLLDPLETDHRVAQQKSMKLGPIPVEAGLELIKSPRLPSDAPDDWSWEEEITPAAAERIHALWSEGLQAPVLDHVAVGTLHLQALLYVLANWADDDVITKAHVERFRQDAKEEGRTSPEQVMGFALEQAATMRLRRARQAGKVDSVGMDEFLLRGVSNLVARAVPHLSSGGFKVEQATSDLAETCLEDSLVPAEDLLRDLAVGGETAIADLVRAVLAVLTAGVFTDAPSEKTSPLSLDRQALALEADKRLSWGTEAWARLLAAEDSDRHTTCGPLMGLSPVAMVIEQLRRFAWVLVWLNHLNLVRIANAGDGEARVTLVHDGFGQALERWSDNFLDGEGTWALFALATPEGESHRWGAPGVAPSADSRLGKRLRRYQKDLSGAADADQVTIHANLGLRGNAILFGHLSHVMFVNCDFRGTLFQGCTFESVTFLNCRLDGTLFSDCVIVGSRQSSEEGTVPIEEIDGALPTRFDQLRTPPQYVIDAQRATELADVMTRYRGAGAEGDLLLAQPPGNPCVTTADPGAGALFVHSADGLTIQGSRVSALTMRQTQFRGGRLLFRRVRGAGIDLTGFEGDVQVDFQRSLLRHVAFSHHGTTDTPLQVRVQDCATAQWWVGAGFTGSFAAWRSHLAQLWIESDDSFVPRLDPSCHVSGIVAELDVHGASLGARDAARDLPVSDAGALGEFSASTRSMDYLRVAEPLSSDSLEG